MEVKAFKIIIDNINNEDESILGQCSIEDGSIFDTIKKALSNNETISSSDLTISIIGYQWKEVRGGDSLIKFRGNNPNESSLTVYIHCDLNSYTDSRVKIDKEWHQIIKRLYYYCGSSIWNYYYHDESSDILNWIIKEISLNIRRYQLEIGKEYRAFSYRKRKQSFLETGHGKDVVPFLFHSEFDIRKKLLERLQSNAIGFGYKWKILLVDDKAEKGLEGDNTIGKKKIIEEDLNRLISSDKAGDSNNIVIEYAITKDDALQRIQSGCRYDLILLDYVLKEEESINYGTDILEAIDSDRQKYMPSPAEEYNFMFISAYPTAVQDELLAKGYYSKTSQWFLRRGACPTNTPWLFLYELYRMMEHRVEQLQKHLTMIKQDPDELKSPTAISFITWLYSCDGEVRDRCKNSFNAFLTLRSTYDRIKYDIYDGKEHLDENQVHIKEYVNELVNESHLIRSMFPDITLYSNTFWEHIQHLVYLTAYGTNRQWSEMWEELMCISQTLEMAETETKVSLHTVVNLIRNYILGLKNTK